MKKWVEYSILISILIPLFFINIKSSHDWGDDFAQYIHQAKNIIEGISQNETGYVYNENNAIVGPQAYPTGFSLILSLIIEFFGEDFEAFNYLMSFFLASTAIMAFLIIRQSFSFISTLIAILIVLYNPYFLDFKTQILSDLPYTFFSLCCIYLFYRKENVWTSLTLGVLMAFSIHLRSMGFVLIITYALLKFLTNGFAFNKNKLTYITLLVSFGVFILFKYSFVCNTHYPFSLSIDEIWFTGNENISNNLKNLTDFFKVFYLQNNSSFIHVGIIASAIILAFSILGFFQKLKENSKDPIVIYFTLYIAVIFIYPFGDAGLRFLIPVLFFILIFCMNSLSKNLNTLIRPKYFAVICGLLLFQAYYSPVIAMIETQDKVVEGPQTPEAQETFSFIKNNIDTGTVISFFKPRALALYTNAKTIALSPHSTYSGFRKEIKTFGVNYILINQKDYSNPEESYFVKDTSISKPIFSNEQFVLYKITKTDF